MSNLDERIAQWEKMAREAPDAMAFFSLGNAYREAGRNEDAAQAYRDALQHDPGMSRAYQLLGQTLVLLAEHEEAGKVLTKGYTVAAERGDVMPQRAIGSLLQKVGLPVPEVAQAAPQVEITGEQILDRRTGKPGNKLPDPPMRGPLGQFIYANFSQQTWNEWIRQGTKVINELRLDFSNDQHQKLYEMHMLEWLGVTEADVAAFTKEQQGK